MFLLVPAYPGSPGQKTVKWLCVCVCAYYISTAQLTKSCCSRRLTDLTLVLFLNDIAIYRSEFTKTTYFTVVNTSDAFHFK